MRSIKYFFLLSRPLNVFISVVALALSAYITLGKDFLFFEDPAFWYGVICIAFISATGYWVNDAFDFKIDRVNKPGKTIVNAHLSVKKVLTVYFVVIPLLLAFSLIMQDISLTVINLVSIVLLFLYAIYFKKTTIVGNILIAALTSLVIYYAAVMYEPRMSLVWTMIFAFEITFIRELTKDIEDIRGDLRFNLQTLPIRAGIRVSKRIIFISFIVFLLSCYGPVVLDVVRNKPVNWGYIAASIVLVQVPVIAMMVKFRSAVKKKDFSIQSLFLKILIFTGMLSILFL